MDRDTREYCPNDWESVSKVEELEAEINNLTARLNLYKTLGDDRDATISELTTELTDVVLKNEKLISKEKDSIYNEAEDDVERLEDKLADEQNSLQIALSDVEKLEVEVFLLKRDNNLLEESCREYEAEIAELKEGLAAVGIAQNKVRADAIQEMLKAGLHIDIDGKPMISVKSIELYADKLGEYK